MASMGGGSFSSGMLFGGKYRLQKQLGEGAMGVVWSAVNTATGGAVALKLIVRSDQELQTRLVREARACGLIRHKNVVQVYDVGTTETGDPFLVMELLQGETLAALLARKRRLAPSEAAGIARDVARALSAAHAQRIIHRDLKPANIFLHTEPGEDAPIVKVVDFGVSKNLAQSDGLRTVAGGAVGSPMYMSPEQARAERDVDFRADIWSLGVVLYEMLAGERPFLGDATEVLVKIATAPIPRIGKRVRKIDQDLDRIVTGCLTRDREDRLQPASEVARQLEAHALPPGREPLPSLMDTGGYDAPPVASPGSGGAAFSPGSGATALQRASSPGVGRTDLRPSSQGGSLHPASGPSSGSGGSPLQRSGSWGQKADDDDDMATQPVQARMLAPKPAPSPPADDDWARGGTIPIHPQQAALAAAMSRPAPPAPPPPASSPGIHPTAGEPNPLFKATIPMGLAPPPPPYVAVTQPVSVVPPAPLAPPPAAPKKRTDRKVLAAIGVMLAASAAAAGIFLLMPRRDSSADAAGAQGTSTANDLATQSAAPPAAPPQNTGSAQTAADAPAAAPSTSSSAAPGSEPAPPPPQPTATSTTPPPVKPPATSTGKGGTKASAPSKTGANSTQTATSAKKCGKFKIAGCTP